MNEYSNDDCERRPSGHLPVIGHSLLPVHLPRVSRPAANSSILSPLEYTRVIPVTNIRRRSE